jgi:hypothetical protein
LKVTFSNGQGRPTPKDAGLSSDKSPEVSAEVETTPKEIETPRLLTGSDEEAFDMMQEAQMLIDNPAQFETLMADRQLSQSRKTQFERDQN